MKSSRNLKCKLKEWNKEVFGNVRVGTKVILKEVEEIDRIEEGNVFYEDLIGKRAQLCNEFEEVILREETSWRQKARIN